MLLLATAFSLGVVHSFAPDHLAAVGAFVSRRPSWRAALALGARWGLGHSLSILLLGSLLVLSGLTLPERFEPLAERVVGLMLAMVGIFTIARALRLHAHWHEHAGERHWHVHSNTGSESHDHSHGALLGIGMLHGVAGTGALVIALPVAVAASPASAITFLAIFGLGTIVAMAVFGAAAGRLVTATARISPAWHRGVMVAAGALSAIVGVWWMLVAG